MNDIQREQTVNTIYLAIRDQNYHYAKAMLEVTLKEAVNEMLDKVITLTTECQEIRQLRQKIRELKYDI